jgi:carboxyl-terminal processing protease
MRSDDNPLGPDPSPQDRPELPVGDAGTWTPADAPSETWASATDPETPGDAGKVEKTENARSEPAEPAAPSGPLAETPAAQPTPSLPARDPSAPGWAAPNLGAHHVPLSQSAPVPPSPWAPAPPRMNPSWPPAPGPVPGQGPNPVPGQWQPPAAQNPWQNPVNAANPAPGWPPAAPQTPQRGWPAQNQPSWPPAPPQPPAWTPPRDQGWPGGPGSVGPFQPGPAPLAPAWQAPVDRPLSRRQSRLPTILSIVAACLLSFSGGMLFDHFVFTSSTGGAAQVAPTSGPAANGTQSAANQALLDQAEAIIKQYFVGRNDVTDQQLLYGALKGLVQSLGDTGHSVFLTPSEYQAYMASLNAQVAGIGVLMSSNNGVFTVTKVLTGTPAQAAGMKAGDQITAVDGASTEGWTLDQLGSKIRGTAGTKVTITVTRAGSSAPIDFTITRAKVSVPLVEWGMIPGTHVADIALFEFSTGASDQVASAISAAQKAGATSVVLDLRGNPGGYATEAINVASQFLGSGTVYIEQDASGNQTKVTVNPKIAHNSLPLVVLVDHDSASSSEIVAGAIQDAGRAKVVGVATFGTGTVLQVFHLSDGSAIFLGTSYWLTPNGNKIFGKGITPDQVVTLPAGALPLDPSTLGAMTSSQVNSSGDAQLLAAIALLNK